MKQGSSEGALTAVSFTELYRRHAAEVYRFAFYLSGDAALAEDVVSEAFLRIWDSSSRIRLETVRGYLFTIARNIFLHDLRHRRRESPLDDLFAVPALAPREVQSRQELADTLAALQRLPEADRAALLLRAEQGLSYEEIARILGLSVSAVKVKIHRARIRLVESRKGVAHGSH